MVIARAASALMVLKAAATAGEPEMNAAASPCTYWMHGFGGADKTAEAHALAQTGFNVVVAGGKETIAAVRAAGMRSWLCGGAFGLPNPGDDAHKAVDIQGAPQVWFNSGCPNSPALRAKCLKDYEKMARTEGIEGILVDGCRFASPASGLNPFLTCFCGACRGKAAQLGFDFEAMQRDVAALHDALTTAEAGSAWLATPVGAAEWLTRHPGVVEWLAFRRACVTEHFRALSGVIHGAGLEMGVYIFTPSLAPLVGQSYHDLKQFVDVFAPMIYRNYPKRPGIACLNWELAMLPEELGFEDKPGETAAVELVLRWAGLAQTVQARTVAALRQAVPPEAVGHQTALARALIGPDKRLAPIIYIDDPEMARTAALVRQAGADGLNFFVYKSDWARMVRPAFAQ